MGERSLELTTSATRDIEAVVEWYDARSAQLGDQFLDRRNAVFHRISTQPLIYPELELGVRRGLLKRFPHAVYYAPDDKRVIIVAVLHTSRRPDYWKDRDS